METLIDNALRNMLRQEFQFLKNELLGELKKLTDKSDNKDIRLNINQASEYTGISKSHLYKLTSQKNIPHFKQAKHLFFLKSTLDSWLMENHVKSLDELKEETYNFLNSKKGHYGKTS